MLVTKNGQKNYIATTKSRAAASLKSRQMISPGNDSWFAVFVLFAWLFRSRHCLFSYVLAFRNKPKHVMGPVWIVWNLISVIWWSIAD